MQLPTYTIRLGGMDEELDGLVGAALDYVFLRR